MSAILSPALEALRTGKRQFTPLAPIAEVMSIEEHQALADIIAANAQASDIDEMRAMAAAIKALEDKADARFRLMHESDHSDFEIMGAICDSLTEARVFAESLIPEPPTPEEIDGDRADALLAMGD